jgi:hypothetical protein
MTLAMRAPAPLRPVSMRAALGDEMLLGRALPGDSWRAWQVLLIAAMGEELDPDERAIFRSLTGRDREPLERVDEFWTIAGRRGGKSRAISVLIVYLATLIDHTPVLAIGERPEVLCMAPSQKQAGVVFGYVAGLLEATPLLAGLIKSRSADSLSLANGISISIRAASFRNLRGVTAVAVIADECAFWYSEESGAANTDTAILDAVRPSLATTGGPLIAITTPYAKRGSAYETFARHFGSGGDKRILVAQGASRDLNPSLPQAVIDRALERDPVAARAEYLGEFRSDLEAFLSLDAVKACVEPGVFERAPAPRVSYVGFVDPSGGSADSFTAAVAHREDDKLVLDAAREIRPPFSPEAATAELASFLRRYRVSTVRGDRYAGMWPREAFSRHGVRYETSDRDASALYLELLPAIMSRRASLVDNPRLVAQLASLERRAAVFGKDRIDHPPNAHDDLANAVARAFALLSASGNFDSYVVWANTLALPAPAAALAVEPLSWRGEPQALPPPRGNELTKLYLDTKAEAMRGQEGAATCHWCHGLIAPGEAFRSDGWTSFHYPRCVES